MFSDGVLPLVERGVINNSRKRKHRGRIVTTFAMGSQALYDFVDDNPEVFSLMLNTLTTRPLFAKINRLCLLTAHCRLI